MKIIIYSDLHLEFGTDFLPPAKTDADLMILAGDIINLNSFNRLERFLKGWEKPVLYVNGNHEHYTNSPMDKDEEKFIAWIADNKPNVKLLRDEAVSIQGINFFGGTMWTDFNGADQKAMHTARAGMNDFRLIRNPDRRIFDPADTMALHQVFKKKLLDWFDAPLQGPHVVVTHHAPVVNPKTKYANSPLMPAFNSLDMVDVIKKYQPELWIYGHTHECDRQTIGKTRIISNQLGYPERHTGAYECGDFDPAGVLTEL